MWIQIQIQVQIWLWVRHQKELQGHSQVQVSIESQSSIFFQSWNSLFVVHICKVLSVWCLCTSAFRHSVVLISTSSMTNVQECQHLYRFPMNAGLFSIMTSKRPIGDQVPCSGRRQTLSESQHQLWSCLCCVAVQRAHCVWSVSTAVQVHSILEYQTLRLGDKVWLPVTPLFRMQSLDRSPLLKSAFISHGCLFFEQPWQGCSCDPSLTTRHLIVTASSLPLTAQHNGMKRFSACSLQAKKGRPVLHIS